jgi:hypothetical protein
MFAWNWYTAKQTDYRVVSLYSRHYSAGKNGKAIRDWRGHGIGKPGQHITLLTSRADALFLWTVCQFRRDGLQGIECAVFRNESSVLSSDLILEAEGLALRKWADMPQFFTYVAPSLIQSSNPGFCFKKAGWKQVGKSPSGLILLTKQIDYAQELAVA